MTIEIVNYPLAFGLLAILSVCIGSLINLIIYRLPLMLRAEWYQCCCDTFDLKPKTKEQKNINLFLPRSFCPHCKTTIRARDNIPILSFLFLRGHCSQCKTKISWRYPLIEALTCLLSLLAAFKFGFNLQLLFALCFIWILITLIFIDIDEQLLPDSLTLGLLWLGLLANIQNLYTNLPNAVLSAAIAYLSLWLFIKIYYLITGKIGMGHGDFKLFAALSAWFGWTKIPLILIGSSLTGAILGFIFLTLKGKTKDTPIPFGPFLCFAGIIVLFFGESLQKLYLV